MRPCWLLPSGSSSQPGFPACETDQQLSQGCREPLNGHAGRAALPTATAEASARPPGARLPAFLRPQRLKGGATALSNAAQEQA